MEQQYEYAVFGDDGGGDRRLSSPDHTTREAVEPIAAFTRDNRPRIRNVRIVRRPVGEWEDVPGDPVDTAWRVQPVEEEVRDDD